ncbi:MAG: hypothetical protein N4A46_13645 [Schleiferiaceae bacterium]|jgi:hypothetical protein|nr:hypothetical protein [Schleiferiaceae bacterium]
MKLVKLAAIALFLNLTSCKKECGTLVEIQNIKNLKVRFLDTQTNTDLLVSEDLDSSLIRVFNTDLGTDIPFQFEYSDTAAFIVTQVPMIYTTVDLEYFEGQHFLNGYSYNVRPSISGCTRKWRFEDLGYQPFYYELIMKKDHAELIIRINN